MKYLSLFLCVVLCAAMVGCASFTLAPVDYSWPVESVLKADAKGMVEEARYSMTFNVKPLLFQETGDSVNVTGAMVRIIRDMRGDYFITGPKFKNVYVFAPDEGKLKQVNRILVAEKGMEAPAMNQRPPYIQLIHSGPKPILLSRNGIEQQGGQK